MAALHEHTETAQLFNSKPDQTPIPERGGINPGTFVCVTPRRNPKIDWKKPNKPCARSGHAAVADGNNLYIFGGYNPDLETLQDYFGRDEEMLFPLFQEIWRYNFDANSWTRLPTRGRMPTQLASMSMVLFSNSHILIFGGTGFPFGPTTSNDVWHLNLKDRHWKAVKAKKEVGARQPVPGYGQAMVVIGNNLYVYGGTTGWEYNSDVHRCHLTSGRWDRLFSLEEFYTAQCMANTVPSGHVPKPRYRHEILTDGKRLFIIGGGTSLEAYTLEKIHAFNLETREWELMETVEDPEHGFPENRRCHGCAQLDNEGYITGGYGGKKIFDDIWRLELGTLQWTRLGARLPRPVYFHSSAVTPAGCLYYHGGVVNSKGDERSDSLTRIWLKTPSLLTTCWEKVLSLIPDLHALPTSKLLELGIPRHLFGSS